MTGDVVTVIEEVDADKGYHSRTTVHDLKTLGIRTYISEPDRGHSRGPIKKLNATRCTRIGDGFTARVGNGCCDGVEN